MGMASIIEIKLQQAVIRTGNVLKEISAASSQLQEKAVTPPGTGTAVPIRQETQPPSGTGQTAS